ncbi:hypothetical protein [Shivajiella indica]|uniref:Tetratricopeptide repeat protein n=1 Tax=Shivajiella indica TaxID=872115 RepID=A0ABW5BCR4_9BACT
MNPIQLLGIIKNGNHLNKDDFNDLIKIHETFPFFQIPKVLLAKYEFTTTSGHSKELLPWASVTSPDRVWLKKMVETEAPFEQIANQIEVQMAATITPQKSEFSNNFKDELKDQLIPEPQKKNTNKDLTATLKKLGEDLALSKMKALEKLDRIEKKSTGPIAELDKIKPAQPEENPIGIISQPIETKSTIIEKADEGEKEKSNNKKRKVYKDELIESIRRKEKKEIVDKKKQEQIDIIKAFSKKEIKLATLKELEGQQRQDDLSEKSTQLNPDLVTEAYAKLLIKQGKNLKAKEIYKKLMVKFPDKNTYFADRLKELEENNP